MNTAIMKVVLLLFAFVIFSTHAEDQIAPAVQKQIADILAMKGTFTAAEQKMSSNLVFASRLARGISIGPAAGLIDTVAIKDGAVSVDIHARVSDELLNKITNTIGKVERAAPKHNRIRASVPLANLHLLAADAAVTSVREPEGFLHNVGALTSQGIVVHGAKPLIAGGITGAGVKVGVLSDSASAARVTALMASGDLGANTTVLTGQSGAPNSDEGAAMMEIVQDMAPGAQLFFATAEPTQAVFAANIAALAAAGCTIIVDDITYFEEPAFQDGIVAKAVNTFVAGGGLYFSSGANSGNLSSSTSGTWEGDFLDAGLVSTPISPGRTGNIHNFGTAAAPQTFNTLTDTGSRVSLKWADPVGGATDDYDLFVLNSTGTSIHSFSASVQNGTQDPVEIVTTSSINDRVVVVKHSGNAVALRVDAHRGELTVGTTGSTYGHNAGANTVCVAATYWNSAKKGTRLFDGTSNPVENFSSDGPRKVFFNPDGSAITPGNFLFATNGGMTLQKPDITAADGVSCKTPDFENFFGTSAAAPHAAGIAALIKSAKPSLTNTQIVQILKSTALDSMAPGVDRDSGAGVINAQAAVQAALSLP